MSENTHESTLKASTPAVIVATSFQRNGYVRVPNTFRKESEPYGKYKKGYEFRFSLTNQAELLHLRRALESLSFSLGAPFRKHRQLIQPIYGKLACERLSELIQETLQTKESPLEIAFKRMEQKLKG